MNILQLTKKFPYPPKDGEAIAILNITRSLHALGHQVDVLALNTNKHYFDIKQLPERIGRLGRFASIDINTNITPWGALRNLLGKDSYHVSRFYDKRYAQKLTQVLQNNNYDVIHLEGLTMCLYLPLIRSLCDTPVALRAHNIEHEIWTRLAQNTRNPLKKHYLLLQAERLAQFELDAFKSVDALVPITDKDAMWIDQNLQQAHMHCTPTGVNAKDYVAVNSDRTSIGFIGGLDWLPNQEGIAWFIKEVLPLILMDFPKAKFHIAGRNMPAHLTKLASKHVVFEGEVDDAHAFINAHPIFVVPLRSGSGMRIKIIEAMALQRAVVSTEIGAEGIHANDGEAYQLANDAKLMAKHILHLLRHPVKAQKMGTRARQVVEQQFDNDALVAKLVAFYQDLIQKQAA